MPADYQPEYEDSLHDPLCGAVPVTTKSSMQLLRTISSQASGKIIVFDLDSTLLNNRPRNAKIMQEYGVLHQHPKLTAADASHFINWDARNSMSLAGLHAEDIEKHIGPYEEFWLQRFFTSEYCQHDIAIPGAIDFVNEISNQGGAVCYLTGRDESMRAGTHASLEVLGFPVPNSHDNSDADSDAIRLVMNPTREYSDDLFKQQAMDRLKQQGEVLAAFDNEPAHINSYRREFPDAASVHLFTDHSMRKVKLLDGIVSIQDFRCEISAL